jgi:HEAT repeat protein
VDGSRQLFWRVAPDVRSHERTRFLFFAGLVALGAAAQTMGLVGSEALFLSRFGVSMLPQTFIAAALVTVLATLAYAASVGRLRNDWLFLWMTLGAALLLAAATVAIEPAPAFAIPALFCFWYATQAIFQNHFLTFAGDYFDTVTAKRLFPRFGVAASLGSGVGAGLGVILSWFASPVVLIVGWATGLAATGLMLRVARRPLRRWGPLELEEADETSVEGMRGAVGSLGGSALGRFLTLSALGMVLALFVAQYVYSDIFVERFPEPDSLAVFLGSYLFLTNLVEISIGSSLTPSLIRRFGVSSANLIHPLLTLLTFGALGLQYGYASGVAARMNREMLDNAMGFPIRSLVINAMPLRFRGRVRAFLEGVVVYVGMAVAGALLLALGRPDPAILCLAGGAAATLFLGANLRVRREYIRALVREMRAGRLDFQDVSEELGRWETSRLAELWEGLLADTAGARGPLLDMVPTLAERGIDAPLVRAASHPDPQVRRACLEALSATSPENVEATLALALDDPNEEVRLAALRGLTRLSGESAFAFPRIRDRLDDPDPEVRAEAAGHCGEDGRRMLEAMIESDDPAAVEAALRAAPEPLLPAVLRRFDDEEPGVRAAALERAAVIASEAPLDRDALRPSLEHSDARVRRAALQLIATFPPTRGTLEGVDDAPEILARALFDVAPEVRRVARLGLSDLGESGVAAVMPHLRSECERAVRAGLRVLSAAPDARTLLGSELHWHVRDLWFVMLAFQHSLARDGLAGRFATAAFRDAIARHERITFRILELLEDEDMIRRVERAMRFGSAHSQGNALEVLSNLGDRESAELLVLLHEPGALEERAARARALGAVLPADGEEVLEHARQSASRWLRMAANAREMGPELDSREEEVMERLLALGRVPLFATLSLEQLEALQRITREVAYLPGEVICRESDPGNELFVITEGRVKIFQRYGEPGAALLTTYEAGGTFGEMAIFGGERRTATAVADAPSRLLSLDGNSLKELILQMPEISFEIFGTLTERVRKAEQRQR